MTTYCPNSRTMFAFQFWSVNHKQLFFPNFRTICTKCLHIHDLMGHSCHRKMNIYLYIDIDKEQIKCPVNAHVRIFCSI